MPKDLSDFPEIVAISLDIYNRLGDRFLPGSMDTPPMFIGKDLSALNVVLDIFEIYDPYEKQIILDIIGLLDNKAVKTALNKLKKPKRKFGA